MLNANWPRLEALRGRLNVGEYLEMADPSCNVPVPSDDCAREANAIVERQVRMRSVMWVRSGYLIDVLVCWYPLWHVNREINIITRVGRIWQSVQDAVDTCEERHGCRSLQALERVARYAMCSFAGDEQLPRFIHS